MREPAEARRLPGGGYGHKVRDALRSVLQVRFGVRWISLKTCSWPTAVAAPLVCLPASAAAACSGAPSEAPPAAHRPAPCAHRRIASPSFWGGEAELLVLSKLLKTPIQVYLPEAQARADSTPHSRTRAPTAHPRQTPCAEAPTGLLRCIFSGCGLTQPRRSLFQQAGGTKFGMGFVKIQEYGSQFSKTKSGAQKKPVKLLYNGNNQCASLLPLPAVCVGRQRLAERS